MEYEKNWKDNSQMAIDHWGKPHIEPEATDLANESSFKNYLMTAYGWDEAQAIEELKWFSDFTRTFESK